MNSCNYVDFADLNSCNYLTSIPSQYITESELNAKNYIDTTELSQATFTIDQITNLQTFLNEVVPNMIYYDSKYFSQSEYFSQSATTHKLRINISDQFEILEGEIRIKQSVIDSGTGIVFGDLNPDHFFQSLWGQISIHPDIIGGSNVIDIDDFDTSYFVMKDDLISLTSSVITRPVFYNARIEDGNTLAFTYTDLTKRYIELPTTDLTNHITYDLLNSCNYIDDVVLNSCNYIDDTDTVSGDSYRLAPETSSGTRPRRRQAIQNNDETFESFHYVDELIFRTEPTENQFIYHNNITGDFEGVNKDIYITETELNSCNYISDVVLNSCNYIDDVVLNSCNYIDDVVLNSCNYIDDVVLNSCNYISRMNPGPGSPGLNQPWARLHRVESTLGWAPQGRIHPGIDSTGPNQPWAGLPRAQSTLGQAPQG